MCILDGNVQSMFLKLERIRRSFWSSLDYCNEVPNVSMVLKAKQQMLRELNLFWQSQTRSPEKALEHLCNYLTAERREERFCPETGYCSTSA